MKTKLIQLSFITLIVTGLLFSVVPFGQTAGTIDLGIDSPTENFYPSEIALNMKPGDLVQREVRLFNLGDNPLEYSLTVEKISGDDDFCNALQLDIYSAYQEVSVWKKINIYNGNLMNVNIGSLPVRESDVVTGASVECGSKLFFTAYFPDYSNTLQNKTCQFKFVFSAQQAPPPELVPPDSEEPEPTPPLTENVLNILSPNVAFAYFSDTETITNTLKSGQWVYLPAPGGPGYPYPSVTTIHVPDDYPTIQAAVDAANPGDTIIVRDGTYTENVNINKDHLTIKSENGAEKTIVQDKDFEKPVFGVTADYTSIIGFTVKGMTDYGIALFWGTKHSDISNNIVSNTHGGIVLLRSDYNTIAANRVINNSSGISLWDSSNNTIQSNNVLNNQRGISLESAPGNTLTNNTMANNKYNLNIEGSQLSHFTQSIDTSNKVNGKSVYYWVNKQNQEVPSNAGYVAIVDSKNIIIKDLTLTNNGQGILLVYSTDSIIENTNISNSDLGINLLSSSNNNIKNNVVSNNDVGIALQYSSDHNTIENNNVILNDDGLALDNSSGNSLYLNNFVDNTNNVWYSYDSTNTWNSPEKITYTYQSKTYTNYLGNYWDDYTGSDVDGDGIGDSPYNINRGDETKAHGIIRVYNAYSTSPQFLLAGTRFVSADGKLFRSLEKIVIPGAKIENGELVPGYIDVEVEAQQPGEEYNIGPSTFALPALAGTSLYTTIYGKSFEPMTGGSSGIDGDKDDYPLMQLFENYVEGEAPQILPVPYYYQGDTAWCVPTSMSMIFRYYGKNIHSWDIAKDWNLGRDEGLRWLGEKEKVYRYFDDHDLVPEKISKDFDTIRARIDEGKPVFLSMPLGIKHAVVVVGYSLAGGSEKIYINDPSGALMLKFPTSVVGNLPYIAVELDWNDVAKYTGWSSYAIAVSYPKDKTPPPSSKGTIDIEDRGIGFWHKYAHPRSQVYGWFYGHDKGLIWKNSKDHALALDVRDYYQFSYHVTNHMRGNQRYVLEIEFASDLVLTKIWQTVSVKGRDWAPTSNDIMNPIPVTDLLQDYGEYTLTLRLWDEKLAEKYDEVVFPSIKFTRVIEFILDSPADLYLTDPQGLHVGVNPSTKQEVNEIAGATYTGPGSEPQVIAIPAPEVGDYMVEVVPRPDASPTDTYSLKIWADGISVVLAEDVLISDIPDQPYLIQSTETEINAAPVADVNGPYKDNEGSPIIFDGSGSYDPDGEIILYEWDFDGDGIYEASSTSATTTHTWGDDYQGEITLRVTDDEGLTAIDTAEVTVNNVSPVVEVGLDQEIFAGDTVNFSDSFSDPGWLDTHIILWDFGDGATSTGILIEENNPPDATGIVSSNYIYYDKGTYTVTLTVFDDDGGIGTNTLEVLVKPIPANIDCDPDTLNLQSNGKWITCYIELSDGPQEQEWDVWQIDGSTVLLNEVVPAYLGREGWAKAESNESNIMDYDQDGELERMVKFDCQVIQEILEPGDSVELLLEGKVFYNAGLADFEGFDEIKVINKGRKLKFN